MSCPWRLLYERLCILHRHHIYLATVSAADCRPVTYGAKAVQVIEWDPGSP